jgi:Fur family ferric uptake transcriptional regulator
MKKKLLRTDMNNASETPGIEDALRAAELRVTGPRLAILELLRASSIHPTVEDLYARLRPAHPSLSLSTVYKTLEALEAAGLCRRVKGEAGTLRVDGTTHPHHHAVCRGCSALFDVPPEAFSTPPPPTRLPGGLSVKGVHVEFDVLCPRCAKGPKGPPSKRSQAP